MDKLKNVSVVVVDDDSMMREMIKLILRSESYSVIGEASDGLEAIELCRKLQPKLVMLDINMPKMDGLQALAEIRKVSKDTIVIIVSADSTMDKVGEAIKNGAAGFVVKPLNTASVINSVETCLKQQK